MKSFWKLSHIINSRIRFLRNMYKGIHHYIWSIIKYQHTLFICIFNHEFRKVCKKYLKNSCIGFCGYCIRIWDWFNLKLTLNWFVSYCVHQLELKKSAFFFQKIWWTFLNLTNKWTWRDGENGNRIQRPKIHKNINPPMGLMYNIFYVFKVILC